MCYCQKKGNVGSLYHKRGKIINEWIGSFHVLLGMCSMQVVCFVASSFSWWLTIVKEYETINCQTLDFVLTLRRKLQGYGDKCSHRHFTAWRFSSIIHEFSVRLTLTSNDTVDTVVLLKCWGHLCSWLKIIQTLSLFETRKPFSRRPTTHLTILSK